MLKRISHTFIHVLDQDEALDFYVGTLGMVVHTDADLEVMRFLTVNLPDQPNVELVLMLPGPPAYDDATASEVRELVANGAAGGGVIFETDDCRGTYESLQARALSSRRSRRSASTASTVRCATRSGTRSASRNRRRDRLSCRRPRS
jgi:hypothetical protein